MVRPDDSVIGSANTSLALGLLVSALEAAGRPEEAVAVANSAIEDWRAAGEPDLPAMS